MDKNDPRAEGRAAFEQGLSLSANPYQGDEGREWAKGWKIGFCLSPVEIGTLRAA